MYCCSAAIKNIEQYQYGFHISYYMIKEVGYGRVSVGLATLANLNSPINNFLLNNANLRTYII